MLTTRSVFVLRTDCELPEEFVSFERLLLLSKDEWEKTAKKRPWYFALRAGSGKISAMLVKIFEKIMPAPRPWMPLNRINSTIPHAAPHSALPTANSARPPSRIGRLPNRFAKWPDSGRNATPARVYAEPIHTNCWPSKWLMMVGSAVETAL